MGETRRRAAAREDLSAEAETRAALHAEGVLLGSFVSCISAAAAAAAAPRTHCAEDP